MIKALLVGLLVLLYLEKGSPITCLQCKNVALNNVCTHEEGTCESGLWKFCFTRLTSEGSQMIRVDRGCSSLCYSVKRSNMDHEENMLCCVRDLCNSHNFWTNL